MASAKSPGLETPASFRTTSQKIHVESVAGNFEIPLDRLQFEKNDTGRFLLYDAQDPERMIWCAEPGLLQDYFLTRHVRLRPLLKDIAQQKEGVRSLKLAVAFLIVFALVCVAAWFAITRMADFIVSRVPPAWEKVLGDAVNEQIKNEVNLATDPEQAARLRAITEPLLKSLPKSDYKFEFFLVTDELPNAFAIPGGRVFVHSGLMKMADRPEEVAGVLAHEIAHVTRRHGLRHIVTSLGPWFLLGVFVGDNAGFLTALSEGSRFLLQQSFSRDFEREADRMGFDYLVKANIDPRGLEEFLQKLAKDSRFKALEKPALKALSSHPPSAERVEYLVELWQKSPKKSGFTPLKWAEPAGESKARN